MVTNPSKKYEFDSHNVLSLGDAVPETYGLYKPYASGGQTREAKEEIFRKLLKDRIMLINFMSKSSKDSKRIQRFITLNHSWIGSEPAEIDRLMLNEQAEADRRMKGLPVTSRSDRGGKGIISVYDVEKPGWISFDVDYVVMINAIKSDTLKRLTALRGHALDVYKRKACGRQDLIWHVEAMMRPFIIENGPLTTKSIIQDAIDAALKNPNIFSTGAGPGAPGGTITPATNWPGAAAGGGGGGVSARGAGPLDHGPASTSEPHTIKYEITQGQKEWLDRLRGATVGEVIKVDKEDIKPESNTINSLADWIQSIYRGGGGIR